MFSNLTTTKAPLLLHDLSAETVESSEIALEQDHPCGRCGRGYFADELGLASCKRCPAGKYSDEACSACAQCSSPYEASSRCSGTGDYGCFSTSTQWANTCGTSSSGSDTSVKGCGEAYYWDTLQCGQALWEYESKSKKVKDEAFVGNLTCLEATYAYCNSTAHRDLRGNCLSYAPMVAVLSLLFSAIAFLISPWEVMATTYDQAAEALIARLQGVHEMDESGLLELFERHFASERFKPAAGAVAKAAKYSNSMDRFRFMLPGFFFRLSREDQMLQASEKLNAAELEKRLTRSSSLQELAGAEAPGSPSTTTMSRDTSSDGQTTFDVKVPANASAGTTIEVKSPLGHVIHVQVPLNTPPGAVFSVAIPAVLTVPTTATDATNGAAEAPPPGFALKCCCPRPLCSSGPADALKTL